MDFDYSISLPSICTPVTMGAVAAIHEYKGKQELYQALKPESFEKLAAVARVQSIGSSNKTVCPYRGNAERYSSVASRFVRYGASFVCWQVERLRQRYR